MEDKRIADYFVVAGLPQTLTFLSETSGDCNSPKSCQRMLPITDIAVIIRSQGEMPPNGYSCIETTPFGFPADLNHGSLRSPNIYLCYRRGRDKPPLVDIGVLFDGKERVMSDSEVVWVTPAGRPANVNNSGSRTFLTYRRALDNAPCNQLVVTDICVILASKGEHPPRAFCLIDKNLNKGMLGSDVFLCYKKSMNSPDMLCYTPGILDRFPLENYEDFPLPQSVAVFCLPMGATVECWPKSAVEPKPLFSTFVLTSDSAEKVYGAAVTFYEKFKDEKLKGSMRTHLNYISEDHQNTKAIFANKSICILSRWPFYDTFEKFLRYLHRISTLGVHKVPIERIISHFMLEIPFPFPQRPRILIQLADCTVSLSQPADSPLPLSGASYGQLLRNLGPDNCLKVLFYVLTEQKLLFHSLRPDVLTSVAEAVVHFIFPFHWQCPYIPLCPLGFSDVLSAPVPFLVGVDSRYFDLYDPPNDVTCIDLDTNSIFLSEEKKSPNVKLLPKRPARMLRNKLQVLYEKLGSLRNSGLSKAGSQNSAAIIDYDFKTKKREHQLQLEIQEAFLRFMSLLLKGYRNYLKPITTAPTIGTTDPNSLFDLQGFLKSRDKTHSRFYMYMMKTQMFIRFIEERSFVSDKDAGLAFFDECTEKVDSSDYLDVHLLEMDDSQTSDRTVFIAPPEPIGLPPGVNYEYKEFGVLKPQLFHKHPAKSLLSVAAQSTSLPSSPMARRTKQEIKSAQKIARKQSEIPLMWAKCLVSYCFSLWFIHLPALVKMSPSKASALRLAFDVLTDLQKSRHNIEEVCYRVLMLLCGLYSQPTLAVKVLFEMKRHGIQPNAITYGYYNKAVLESKWPSADVGQFLMWNKLRNVILGVSQFRQNLKKKARRSISLSSDMDYDCISRTSTESSNTEDMSLLKINQPIEPTLSSNLVNSGQTDLGYSSLSHVEETAGNSMCNNSHLQKHDSGKPVASRRLKFCDIDFSESDEFRSRIGSIVKSSATSLNSLAQLHDSSVDSKAGILMTSQAFSLENYHARCDIDSRRRHKSAGEHSCRQYKRYKMQHNCSASICDSTEASDKSFLRSYSFGNDFQIICKIRETKDKKLNEKSQDSSQFPHHSPLQSSEKKPNDSDQVSDSFQQCAKEAHTDLNWTACDSNGDILKFVPRPYSPTAAVNNDVLQLRDRNPACNSPRSFREKAFISNKFTPLKEAWLNFDFFSGTSIPKMANSLSNTLGFGVLQEQDRSPQNFKVIRSSTFHSNGQIKTKLQQNKALDEALLVDTSTGLSRSPTLPVTHKPPGNTSSGWTKFSGSSSSFGISRLTSKHSEVLMDSLKSAVTSVSTKLNEFKSSLSATSTPTKGNSNYSLNMLEGGKVAYYSEDDICTTQYDRKYCNSMYNSGQSEGLLDVNDGRKDSVPLQYDNRYSLPQIGSARLFSSQAVEAFEKLNNTSSDHNCSSKVAMEISMTTCSCCMFCSSLLYDEEIMEGWSADDSNLNTQCTFCKLNLVPSLTVTMKDYRWEGSMESLSTTGRSTESISNAHMLNSTSHKFSSTRSLGERSNSVISEDEIIQGENIVTDVDDEQSLQHHIMPELDKLSDVKVENNGFVNSGCSLDELELLSVADTNGQNTNDAVYPSQSGSHKPSTLDQMLEPILVPYLSPLVLRKELENVLEHEGDNCMTKSEFVDQHPILFWNLLWFFKRIGVPSHLSSLILFAQSVTKGKQISPFWQNADFRNVLVHCCWDNVKLHVDMGQPLYVLWANQVNKSQQSSLLHALVTDETKASKNVMKQVLAKLQCNDLSAPISMLMTERRKSPANQKRHHSIYREILFLSFIAINRQDIDNLTFDVEYRKAYELMSNKQLSQLQKNDKPPSEGTVFCRQYFKDLELKVA